MYSIDILWVGIGVARDIHPIVRNPVALKETLMLGFIAKARIWQPQSVSCLLPVLLICPNKRSLLDARVIGGHPFLSQPLFLPRCLLPPIGEIKNVAYRVTGLSLETDYCNLGNQLTVVWSIGYPASIIANPCALCHSAVHNFSPWLVPLVVR